MLDLQLIEDTIEELEQGETNFINCQNLASLYTVREYMRNGIISNIESELDDILPQYRYYCSVKRKYQLNDTTEENVTKAMKDTCKEIVEFIKVLYANTDMERERRQIRKMIQVLYNQYIDE